MIQLEINNLKVPSWNTFYSGKHWAVRQKMADEIHQLVYYKCLEKKIPLQTKPVRLKFTIYYKYSRKHDIDNACIKPVIDGLALAKVLKDDNIKYIKEICIKMLTNQATDKIIIQIL